MSSAVERVHVIFKTHLDVGFTDYARQVVRRYFDEYIPGAMRLAAALRDDPQGRRFRWTIGSWLIYEYLESAPAEQRRLLEAAIARGDITWHGLPFTTHTELMDAELFRAGLSIAQELDRRFGRQTIAAKMTDVPGHTRAMVPLLAEAGIRFLHIGVNEAPRPPAVPPIFVWKDQDSGTDVIVIYHHAYGEVMSLPGTGEAFALVMTGDNLGPPAQKDVIAAYAALRQQFPDAHLIASTLDAVARTLVTVHDWLPVVTAEIGDTWIQGVGSDPTKVRHYRELLRLRRAWQASGKLAPDDPRRLAFNRRLLLIPEHTWGLDEKTHLADYAHYDTAQLAEWRKTPSFQRFEASWDEQRAYLDEAIAALDDASLQAEARAAIQNSDPQRPDLRHYQPTSSPQMENAHFRANFDPATGALVSLQATATGQQWAAADHALGLLTYELFSAADYERYWEQYMRDRDRPEIQEWARLDNTKPGLPAYAHECWQPIIDAVYARTSPAGEQRLFVGTMPQASQQYGAPARVCLEYLFHSERPQIDLALSWYEKPACRLPEAFWLSFRPRLPAALPLWLDKMGRRISPRDVVSGGGRSLHAVERGLTYGEHILDIDSLDAPLVAPGRPALLEFTDEQPDLSGGVHFNLYNNVWGTNFPMWFEDDAVFRFRLRFGG